MEEKRFTLRMDKELFEKVKAMAEENRRSVAKEIEYQLSQYIKAHAPQDKSTKE